MAKQITLRIPEDLYKALERDAHKYGRTVAQSCKAMLSDGVIEDFFKTPFTNGDKWQVTWSDGFSSCAANFLDSESTQAFYKVLTENHPYWQINVHKVGIAPRNSMVLND